MGSIDAINASVDVQYSGGEIAHFEGQIIITPGNFSAGGDSGSLVVAAERPNARRPVGLVFAGSDTISVANPIDAALDYFGVRIVRRGS